MALVDLTRSTCAVSCAVPETSKLNVSSPVAGLLPPHVPPVTLTTGLPPVLLTARPR